MKLSHPKHPVWLIGMLLALGAVFAMQAKTFDADEIRNWVEVIGLVGLRELLASRGWRSSDASDGE